MKTLTILGNLSVREMLMGRFNPIASLTPEKLARELDNFHAGYFFEVMRLWELIERRDDTLACVAPKRKKAVARRTFEVLITKDGEKNEAQAQRHKQALEYFYNNVSATHATDAQEKGGWSLLLKQMMDSVGKKYATHEIIWQPNKDGLTAELRFVPPWFFEARTGTLRFLAQSGQEGVMMNPGEWMVTVGEGLMEASSVCYMYKRLPLRDWLVYCGRNGMPGIAGETPAAVGSPEWNKMEEAVASFAAEFAGVFGAGGKITAIDLTAKGELPYPALIERMDRKLSAIWRGGDLSSMSAGAGQGQGASVQGDESDLLEQDDAAQLTSTLNAQLDPFIIKNALGDERPLAYIKIIVPERTNVELDLKVDTALVNFGVPLSQSATAERYGRALADPAMEPILQKPVAITDRLLNEPPAQANARSPFAELISTRANARRLDAATRKDLAAALEALEKLTSGEMTEADLKAFHAKEPQLLRAALANTATRDELEKIYGTAAINGLLQGAQERAQPTTKK